MCSAELDKRAVSSAYSRSTSNVGTPKKRREDSIEANETESKA